MFSTWKTRNNGLKKFSLSRFDVGLIPERDGQAEFLGLYQYRAFVR